MITHLSNTNVLHQLKPITITFDGSVYIPSRLVPTDKIINKFFTTRLKKCDYIYYDINGVIGEKRDTLNVVKNNKVSKPQLVDTILKNIDRIVVELKKNIDYQRDVKYGVELLQSDNYNYVKLGIYLLLNGELNIPSLGFVNIKS